MRLSYVSTLILLFSILFFVPAHFGCGRRDEAGALVPWGGPGAWGGAAREAAALSLQTAEKNVGAWDLDSVGKTVDLSSSIVAIIALEVGGVPVEISHEFEERSWEALGLPLSKDWGDDFLDPGFRRSGALVPSAWRVPSAEEIHHEVVDKHSGLPMHVTGPAVLTFGHKRSFDVWCPARLQLSEPTDTIVVEAGASIYLRGVEAVRVRTGSRGSLEDFARDGLWTGLRARGEGESGAAGNPGKVPRVVVEMAPEGRIEAAPGHRISVKLREDSRRSGKKVLHVFPKGVHERSLSDPSAAPDPLYAIIGVIGEDGAEQLSQAAREVVRLMGERRLPPSESGVGLEEAGVVVKGIALRRPVLARLRFTARPGQEGHGGAANEAMGLLRAGHQSRLWESVLTVNVTPEGVRLTPVSTQVVSLVMPKGALPPRGEVNQLAKVTAETTTASPRVLMDEAGVEEGTRLWDRGYALPGSPFVLSASDGQSKETPMFV